MNTLEEKTEIHKIGQIQRLQTSQHGRKILQTLGYDITSFPPIPPKPPPWDIIPNVMIRPIPQNMDPERHQERRQERAHMLSKRPEPTNCIYTDAVYLHHTQEDDGGGAPNQTNFCGGGDGGVEKRVEAAFAQRSACGGGVAFYGSATQGGGARAYHVTSGGSSGRQLQIRIAP
ncbi:hypothetical protein HPB47_009591 [Ixodes persulcatus]|uniref:Uncharacterized protein n=1 Tax=Ixodes persulcatus TaxID=34615 RepID=A0AC60P1S1_IXOPE|nr:hypothetical protein HPB47_009591 [Ixodes persulcatus]